ncbi:MAG: YqgE/AlgH family protein [Cytophagales bacterium]
MQKKIQKIDTIKKGAVLISMPFLKDEGFFRSVVLICSHSNEGSFGYILNKKTELFLNDVLAENDVREEILFEGGPVETNTLHFIHKFEKYLGGEEITDGYYWGGDYQAAIKTQVYFDTKYVRYFLGYSGWSPGQLEAEIESNSWIVCHVDCNFLFETSVDKLWKNLLIELGGEYKLMSNYPPDPRLN